MKRASLLAALILIGSSTACGDLTGPQIHTFRVTGTVLNAATSKPMSAVKVVAYQPQTDAFFFVIPEKTYTSALTDANGRYSLAFGVEMCAGYFVVSAQAPSPDAVRVEMGGCEAETEIVVNLLVGK